MYPVNILLAGNINNNRQNPIQYVRNFWRREARTDILGLNWVIINSLHNHGLV